MKRWHEDYRVTLREWKEHRRSHVDDNINSSGSRVGKDPNEVDCSCDDQKGRFRKKDAWDCGKARCGICHGDKWPRRILHPQEQIAELNFKEQLRGVNEPRKVQGMSGS